MAARARCGVGGMMRVVGKGINAKSSLLLSCGRAETKASKAQ